MRVVYTRSAIVEIEQISSYIRERNPSAAASVADAIEATTARIGMFPLSASATDEDHQGDYRRSDQGRHGQAGLEQDRDGRAHEDQPASERRVRREEIKSEVGVRILRRKPLIPSDDDHKADIAMRELAEIFSQLQQSGKSKFSGIRYEPKIQDGRIIFVPNSEDITFNKAFNEMLDELFETDEIPRTAEYNGLLNN